MELQAIWKAVRRRWWLAIAPLLVVLVHTIATYRPPAPTYQVVMRFAAGTPPAGLSLDYDRYYPWLTSEYIANGLADVARTGRFAGGVASRLADQGLAVDPAAVRGAIASDNAQSMMIIYLTWGDADGARAVAQAVSDELTTNGEAYFPQLAGLEPAVRRLDEPVPIPQAPGLRAQMLGPAVRLTLALAVGVGLALLWHYLDPTVRSAEEAEGVGLPVIAQIPRHR
jgi:capsular polysaccharide biosynthesis protein